MNTAVEKDVAAIDIKTLVALNRQVDGRLVQPPTRARARREGGYRSSLLGRGMEFAEVRAYQPGDDVRTIDWRVTARTGMAHTKLFQEERERPVLVAVDYRRPMFFATRGCFKAVQASHLAALLAWQAMSQGDRIGAFLFSEQQNVELRPQLGKRGVLALLRHLVDDPAWRRPLHQPFTPQQRLHKTLTRLRRVVRPGSLVTIISDFNQWDDNVEKQLALLRRHNELSLVFCYDPLEQQLPPAGEYPVGDGNIVRWLNTVSAAARQEYEQRFAARRQRIEQFCLHSGSHCVACNGSDEPAQVLQRLWRRGGKR